MSKLLYQLTGVRGRSIAIYDRKVVISTKVSMGSLLSGNATDGEKTIFFHDVVGVQFKKSGGMIGYLQFETSSLQMNNQNSNVFSENTFTFEANKNGITNEQMEAIYHQVCDILEEIKYGNVTRDSHPTASPAMPTAPVAPVRPEAPVVVAPVVVAPVAPAAPVAPVAPVAPKAPVAPVAPVAPNAPEAPVIPVAPQVPEAPVIPVAPIVPMAPVEANETNIDTITCPKCGGSVPSFASFCTCCGERLR